MMKEVEAGNVEYLCIKDMSRMGRDYLKVGQFIRKCLSPSAMFALLPSTSGVDSASRRTMILPRSCNIINEFYARDTSRKKVQCHP